MSIGSSPGLSNRSYATPLRTRPSLAVNPSPLRKNIREPMSSPAKSAPQRATFKWFDTFYFKFFPRDKFAALFWRTPLLRSSSATAPNNYGPPPKAPLFPKTGAMKAVHQQQPQVPPPPAPMKIPSKQPVNAPAPSRRYVPRSLNYNYLSC